MKVVPRLSVTYSLRYQLEINPDSFRSFRLRHGLNVDRVEEIYREGMAQSSIRLANGQILRMSRTGRERLLALGRI